MVEFYVKKNGIVTSKKYDAVWDFSEGLAKVELNDKYGFINKEGKEIVPCKYDSIDDFFEGRARVRIGWKNGKWGFIN